ncbi:replicative DNA helicase [Paenibacillus graminis]|uniref:replicative DNA helicase n=1 Tax=Paenibacillus graminis TaxID=189425 RepID=UPI002DB88946|nr:DnaB-like helicase C-terminal domain-containing protein [Paenibacillus graminis]MEC0171147.1 DnaB-like helicase C-terminal domain-containing protein [Paenibacillus graminis]
MNDFQTEQNVLAGMLAGEKMLYDGLAVVTVDHFYDEEHQIIFAEIAGQAEQAPPSWNIIYRQLRDKINPERLTALKNAEGSENGFSYWLDKLHDLFVRRTYQTAAREIFKIAESGRPLKEITELVEQRIMKVNAVEGTERIVTPEEAGNNALEEFERRVNSGESIHGIRLSREVPTGGMPAIDGFPGMDELFRGLRGGDLIIVSARTGDGKTALAQNIARHASIHQNYRTFYQNTEMSENEMVFRFASQLSEKSFEGIDGGTLDSWDRAAVRRAFELYSKSRIYISHLPTLTPERSRGLARQFKIKYGKLDLIIIDYIGRMELARSNKNRRDDQILVDVAKECKRLAAEVDACVILLAQLNEDGSLQGAKAMANEADGFMKLEPLDKETRERAPRGATHVINTAKARRGQKGKELFVSFNKKLMYMTEVR